MLSLVSSTSAFKNAGNSPLTFSRLVLVGVSLAPVKLSPLCDQPADHRVRIFFLACWPLVVVDAVHLDKPDKPDSRS
jgi:hypothetical protein